MSTPCKEPERAEAFLKDLVEISNKHRVVISGCGCCGSPRIDVLEDGITIGSYLAKDPPSDQLVALDPKGEQL